jgi:hypothetical protein
MVLDGRPFDCGIEGIACSRLDRENSGRRVLRAQSVPKCHRSDAANSGESGIATRIDQHLTITKSKTLV